MFSAGAELAEYWNGSSPTAGDAELFHAGFQGGGLHAQEPGRAALPADAPARPLEHLQDVFAFNLFEGLGTHVRGRARPRKPPAEVQLRALAENYGPLDDILKFPHIPRPGIGLQHVQGRRQEARDALPQPGAMLLRKVSDQEWNVPRPFAKRWQANRDDAQPVVEIGTERTSLNGLLQVPVCRGNDPHVHADGLVTADPLEVALLEHAEQLRLQLQRQIPDLVQEERTPVGELKPPNASSQSARECTLLMSKQFALDQAGGQGGTIDLDQRPVTSRAQIVQRPGHQLLASSRFADEQDRRIGRGDRLDKPEHPLHFWTLAGDFLEVVLGLDLLLQIAVLLFQAGAKPRDLLIRPHVLDGEGNLLRHAFEKRNVLERVSICLETR